MLQRTDVERIAGDAIGAPVPGGRYAQDPAVVARAAESAVSVAERDRTFLQARVTAPAAIAVYRAGRARLRSGAPGGSSALVGALQRVGRRPGRGRRCRRSPSLCRRTGCSPRPRLRTTRSARSSSCSGQCSASAVSRSPSGRCGSTTSGAATCSTGSSSASTQSGMAPARHRWHRTPSSECAQSRRRSATQLRSAARPATRRCGPPTGSR